MNLPISGHNRLGKVSFATPWNPVTDSRFFSTKTVNQLHSTSNHPGDKALSVCVCVWVFPERLTWSGETHQNLRGPGLNRNKDINWTLAFPLCFLTGGHDMASHLTRLSPWFLHHNRLHPKTCFLASQKPLLPSIAFAVVSAIRKVTDPGATFTVWLSRMEEVECLSHL